MPRYPEVESLVIETVRRLAEDFEIEALGQPEPDSPLYGESAPLDSMALVNLIADVEEAVDTLFGASITLADEKAMSARNSPFRDVKSLAEAVLERLEE